MKVNYGYTGCVALAPDMGFLPRLEERLRGWCMMFAAALTSKNEEIADRQRRFRQLHAGYDDMISRICYGYARSNEEFEDLRQDAYVNIWQGLDGFRGDSGLKTWIYRVTLNTCVSSLRKRMRDGVTVDLAEIADTADEDPARMTMIVELHEAISSLSDIDKAIILMWLDEAGYEEIAQVLGMGRNTIASRIRRIKEKLRIKLEDHE